jgi:hypothetical protein
LEGGDGKEVVVLRQHSVWTWFGVLACAGILAVTTVAAIDHVRKTHALERASVSAWYCMHRGLSCDERKPDAIEDAWSRRELGYKAADIGFITVACLAVIVVWRRRQ